MKDENLSHEQLEHAGIQDGIASYEARYWQQQRDLRAVYAEEGAAAQALFDKLQADTRRFYADLQGERTEVREAVMRMMETEEDRLDAAMQIVEAEGYPDGWMQQVWPLHS